MQRPGDRDFTRLRAERQQIETLLHPVLRSWFANRFEHGPTPAQQHGWPAIARGEDTLIAAPTGSGKTLAAFLMCIDRSYRRAERGEPSSGGVEVVYVSPLKALVSDIRHNLEQPLGELRALAEQTGHPAPSIRVGMRSGDTTASARASIVRNPPELLITTPESLYLMLTAAKSRELLRSVKTVIVDEIHALARDKRGAHLALTLERLEHVAKRRPQRIGLSATQRPLERVARLLVGAGAERSDGQGNPRYTLVDVGHRRALDLAIELPQRELEAVASTEQMGEVLDRIAEHVNSRRTTLVFVNTRRLSERVAHLLSERLGADHVAAHHGSLSRERRERVEARLREGSLKALVATASLELGIDVGPVELVCQIGSPRSISTFLQRVGRSGHARFATPVGRLYPLTRDELVECTALLRAVRNGELDALHLPEAPLDILAQQLVAECSAEDWREDELFGLVRRAAPYAELTREEFEATLELVSSGVATGRGHRARFLHRDRIGARVTARRGARLSALTSGGAIPDNADYRVVAEPDDTFVGTINEDFALESMAGDVFLLGSTSWRIRRVQAGVVRVVDAEGAPSSVPFWLGEAPARTAELSAAISELRAELDAALREGGVEQAEQLACDSAGVSPDVARLLIRYCAAARDALGLLPTLGDLVFERFFDDSGGMQLVVHSPYGGRINRALGLLMRKRFCRSFDFELQAAASDDAIVLSLGPQHSFPLSDARDFLAPRGIRPALQQALLPTPMWGVRWRWNLNRALVVLRYRGGRRNPPQLQRMEVDDVTAAIFPALAACQDNATGPREIPDHVLIQQTLRDCFTEALDVAGLEQLLTEIAAGDVRLHFRDTTEPSLLAHEILNARPYAFLDDAPLEERRTRALELRRGLPLEARELTALDPDAIARVQSEVEPCPRTPDELHDLLTSMLVMRPRPSLQSLFASLVEQRRGLYVSTAAGAFWCALEARAALELVLGRSDFKPDLRLPAELARSVEPLSCERAVAQALRGHLDVSGPITLAGLERATGLDEPALLAGLAQLQHEGFVLSGRFETQSEVEYCARRLLSRIHRYTQDRLRREIEPVTPRDFMRFLLRFQGVTADTRRSGQRGLAQVIEQLQGFEVAVASWESDVLRVRVADYRSEWLDGLCFSGDVVWGRLSQRTPREPDLCASVSRATPVTLAFRSDLPWLLQGARGSAPAMLRASQGPASAVIECLEQRGALFSNELAALLGLSRAELEHALWDGVARGLLASDGFGALRSLLHGKLSGALPEAMSAGRLRRGASRGRREGRWALLPSAAFASDPDALAEAVAEQLLARWGVVFPDLLARESFDMPYRELVWALRRLEARGSVRGGRFVHGFSGEQYALPEAIEQLRAVRKSERRGEVVRLAATDPLNLLGIVLPGPRLPALRGRTFELIDGALADASETAPAPVPGVYPTDSTRSERGPTGSLRYASAAR